MTPEDFVEHLRRCVLRDFASDLLTAVADPPGRRPAAELVALSSWYNALDPAGREGASNLVAMAAHHAVHGVLSVLDGARPIETEVGPKGHFELKWVKDGDESILVGTEGGVLHEFL